MKLFVDDERRCPEGWVRARTVTEAIRILGTQEVEEVSLDHDIACYLVTGQEHTSNETFEPVARYIAALKGYFCDMGIPWNLKIRIHTSNFVAGRRMAEILDIKYDHYIYNEKDYE